MADLAAVGGSDSDGTGAQVSWRMAATKHSNSLVPKLDGPYRHWEFVLGPSDRFGCYVLSAMEVTG